MRLSAVFVLILLSASTVYAGDPPPLAAAASEAQVLESLEQARVALGAKKYEDAGKLVEQVLKQPVFAEMSSEIQAHGLRIAGYAAMGRRDPLAAHEFFSLLTEFKGADADDWAQRVYSALHIESFPDAATSFTTLVKRWPDYLQKESDFANYLVRSTYGGLVRTKNQTEKLAMLEVLFAAGYTAEWGTQPSDYWRDLTEAALARNDLAAAAQYVARVTRGETLVAMRIDKRFAPLVSRSAKVFDVRPAAEREVKRLRGVVAKNPRSLGPVVALSYALYTVGDFEEMKRLSDDVLSRVAKADRAKPAYDDIDDQLNWIYNHKATALWSLGRFDKALAAMSAGSKSGEDGHPNVSQAINVGFYLNAAGRPNDALAGLEGIDWAHSLSAYGRMQLQYVRYAAYLQLGDRKNADDVLAWFREHAGDSRQTAQDAFVEGGDLDSAAAMLVSRLHDVTERADALFNVQEFAQAARTAREREFDGRRAALLARADVAAAIAEVGGREKFPIHVIDF